MSDKKEASSVLALQRMYQSLAADIAAAVENKGAGTVKAYEQFINQTIKKAMAALSGANDRFAYKELPKSFDGGQKQAHTQENKETEANDEQARGQQSDGRSRARRVLKSLGFDYGGEALSRDTYIELQSATAAAGNGFMRRVNTTITRLKNEGRDTLGNVREAMVEDMRRNGVLTVEYKNGAKMPLEAYASMAARTARTESVNLGGIGWSLEHGINYVKMSKIFPTCPICARFQDRVYCVDGTDKRFTGLFASDGPLSRGYASVHPHCRHQFSPYNLKFHTPEEIEAEGRQSRALSAAPQEEKERKAYAAWQAGNRQRNTEIHEYTQMKAYYKEKGKAPPYTTLGAYRREARKPKAQRSPVMQSWKNRKRDELQYERWKNEIGAENLPKTLEKFQEIKYNKSDQREFERLKNSVSNEKIRKTLGTNELPLKIHTDKQGKHIPSARTFDKVKQKSFLAVSDTEKALQLSQEIVDEYHGKGTFRRNSRGEWMHTERIETDRVIGFVLNNEGKLVETKAVTIHYSKNGTHIVPTIIDGGDKK